MVVAKTKKLPKIKARECSCTACQKLCLGTPGWFLPGEATRAARFLKMTLQEFFDTYLILEYWVGGLHGEDQYVLSPRREAQKGKKVVGWGDSFLESPCRLLTETGCKLSLRFRPAECRLTFGCKERQAQPSREVIMRVWARKSEELSLIGMGCK